MNRLIVRSSLLLGLVAGALSCGGGKPSAETVQTLQNRLEAGTVEGLPKDKQGARLLAAARKFYEKRSYAPVWFEGRRPGDHALELATAVDGVRADGLDPADYDLGPLTADQSGKRKRPKLEPAQVAEADLRLTATFLRLASHLLVGRVTPGEVDRHWFGQTRDMDLAGVLERAVGEGGVVATLAQLVPQHQQYGLLKKALANYRAIDQRGGWAAVTAVKLKAGTRAPAVATLRQRLAAGGDLPADAAKGDTVDAALIDAVKRFERRHELVDDGTLDAEVLRAMNVPVAERIRQIELNLERWRWLPERFGERYILVNVPTFTLNAVDGSRSLVMRVVAGERENPTPIFSDQMTTIVFSPYWNIPAKIAQEETIPAVLSDPGYLYKNDLEVVRGSRVLDPRMVDWTDDDPDFRIRQRPGSRNSLGHVKFMFPNKFDVYLHDTPADSLFRRVQRDFSHGCVRVEKPEELAQWVLSGQEGWTPEKIRAAMDSGNEQHVALKRQVPVFIVYQTAWVDADGTVHFAEDVYGHDARQIRLIDPSSRAVPKQRIASR